MDHQHAKVRDALNWTKGFVVHGLRHTMLTRLGESGADAFTIMRIAGHSSITIAARYVHPSFESMELAVERLEKMSGHLVGTRRRIRILRRMISPCRSKRRARSSTGRATDS